VYGRGRGETVERASGCGGGACTEGGSRMVVAGSSWGSELGLVREGEGRKGRRERGWADEIGKCLVSVRLSLLEYPCLGRRFVH
jgi:hypothetical protein